MWERAPRSLFSSLYSSHLQMRQSYLLVPSPPPTRSGRLGRPTWYVRQKEITVEARDTQRSVEPCGAENARELTLSATLCLCVEPGEVPHREPHIAPL